MKINQNLDHTPDKCRSNIYLFLATPSLGERCQATAQLFVAVPANISVVRLLDKRNKSLQSCLTHFWIGRCQQRGEVLQGAKQKHKTSTLVGAGYLENVTLCS